MNEWIDEWMNDWMNAYPLDTGTPHQVKLETGS